MAYDIEHNASIGNILQGYTYWDKFMEKVSNP